MRIAGLMDNDVVDGTGISVSYWAQGCPLHCKGCHNEHTWDFDGGEEIDKGKLIKKILKKVRASDVQRNFSVLGGEPLAPKNIENTLDILQAVRKSFPNIQINLWTGYTLNELQARQDEKVNMIFEDIDYLITGRFVLKKRDITLKWRGSKNQKIYKCKTLSKWGHEVELTDVSEEMDNAR
jgi:anaerobic ribonucleoside-triphosphate reductase activating protein